MLNNFRSKSFYRKSISYVFCNIVNAINLPYANEIFSPQKRIEQYRGNLSLVKIKFF